MRPLGNIPQVNQTFMWVESPGIRRTVRCIRSFVHHCVVVDRQGKEHTIHYIPHVRPPFFEVMTQEEKLVEHFEFLLSQYGDSTVSLVKERISTQLAHTACALLLDL